MRFLNVVTLLAVALVLALAANAHAGDGAKKKAKKANKNPLVGTVLTVKKDDGKDTGTFTAKVSAVKKKKDTTPATKEEKTFKITSETKFTTVTGKKTNLVATPAKLSDLSEGKFVTRSEE